MPKGYCKPLSAADKQKIKDEYLHRPIKQIASDIGIGFARVMRFLDRNNLDLPQELRDQRKKDSQRQKGDAPFNKGMKQSDYMSLEAIERTKATRFQKGMKPINALYDGKITIRHSQVNKGERPYKYIRTSPGVWRLFHHVVWEQVNGPIPEGYVIAFKDGDSLNTNRNNLELITYAENMLRNSKHQYPKEIIPSMILTKQLEDKLNSLQNG